MAGFARIGRFFPSSFEIFAIGQSADIDFQQR
jgi:hypothetical protein